MICDDVLTLVSESPAAHGIFAAKTETGRQVFCQVESVTRSEFWRARDNGIEPRYVFRLSEAADYEGEKILLYRGERLRVLRTYVKEHAIELTAADATVDAIAPAATTASTTVSTGGAGEEDDHGGQT